MSMDVALEKKRAQDLFRLVNLDSMEEFTCNNVHSFMFKPIHANVLWSNKIPLLLESYQVKYIFFLQSQKGQMQLNLRKSIFEKLTELKIRF